MKYFDNIQTLEEAKRLYYKLCLQFHPDRGGDLKTMQEINQQYESLTNRLSNDNSYSDTEKTDSKQANKDFAIVINRIITLEGIIVEICGSWIWITGQTYINRNELKEAKFQFSRNKKAWYWHAGEFRKYTNKTLSLEEIREEFGSQIVEKGFKPNNQLNS